MTIEEALEYFDIGSVRTLKRRLKDTGLPEGERTRGGHLTAEALRRLALKLGKPVPDAATAVPDGGGEAGAEAPAPSLVEKHEALVTAYDERLAALTERLGRVSDTAARLTEIEADVAQLRAYIESSHAQMQWQVRIIAEQHATILELAAAADARARINPLRRFLNAIFGTMNKKAPAPEDGGKGDGGDITHPPEIYYANTLRRA